MPGLASGRLPAWFYPPHSRKTLQQSAPKIILDAGVIGTIYTVLRVVPGGWCLECKHPRDPDITWKRRALRRGLSLEDVKARYLERAPVTRADIERVAMVQGKPFETFIALEGIPFDQVPALTECGETPLSLAVPSQSPVLPLATTAAGIVLAAEVTREILGVRDRLHNYFTHDLRFRPKVQGHRFKPRSPVCQAC